MLLQYDRTSALGGLHGSPNGIRFAMTTSNQVVLFREHAFS